MPPPTQPQSDIAEIRKLGAFNGELHCQIVSRKDEETSERKPYLKLDVADSTGKDVLTLWGDSAAYRMVTRTGGFGPGSCVRLVACFTHNKFGLSVKPMDGFDIISELTAMEETLLFRGRGCLGGQSEDREARWKRLESYFPTGADMQISADTPENKAALALNCFCIHEARAFREPIERAAAARGNHHARRGGLLAHILSMLAVADAIAPLYPEIFRPLLLAGVLFHDLAKIYEHDYEPRGFRQVPTTEGLMFGHIPLGMLMVRNRWKMFHMEQYPLLRTHLEHLVLSHHGQKDWGSPIEPMTVEAFALHYIDNLDARVEVCRESFAMPQTSPGIVEARKPLFGSLALPWLESEEAKAVTPSPEE